jgi:hypothetical protein
MTRLRQIPVVEGLNGSNRCKREPQGWSLAKDALIRILVRVGDENAAFIHPQGIYIYEIIASCAASLISAFTKG